MVYRSEDYTTSSFIFKAPLINNIKTRPATTTTRRTRIIHNLELAPNQLRRVVNCASRQKFKRGFIHHHLGATGRAPVF